MGLLRPSWELPLCPSRPRGGNTASSVSVSEYCIIFSGFPIACSPLCKQLGSTHTVLLWGTTLFVGPCSLGMRGKRAGTAVPAVPSILTSHVLHCFLSQSPKATKVSQIPTREILIWPAHLVLEKTTYWGFWLICALTPLSPPLSSKE